MRANQWTGARTFAEQFWDHVPDRPAEGCWVATGAKHRKGYRSFRHGRKAWSMHRASWIVNVGPIPDGLMVLHRCDNPPCVRIDHLFLGTAADNSADMVAKDRWSNKYRKAAAA